MRLLDAAALFLLAAPAFAQEKLSMEEAVRRAVLRSVTSIVAEQEIVRAQGILQEDRALSLPTIALNGTYTRFDRDRVLSAGTGATGPTTSRDQLSANAVVTVPLVAPQRWLIWSHAGDQVDVARLSAEDARRQVAVLTARLYLGVMAQHRLVQIDGQARDAAKAHLDDAHARYEVGSGNRLDEVRAGQELATDESSLALARSNLVRAMEALGSLVGEEGPVDVEDDLVLPEPQSEARAMEDAQSLRPDVRAQKERAEAARRVLRDSYADYLPLLQGVVQPFYQHPATAVTPETGWQASLVLSIPLFDGGARYGLRRERSALYQESRAQLEGLLRQARSDVRTAFDAVRRADESVRSAREAARLAHEALDMTMLAYREGATNDLEVVDAQRRARDADTAGLVAEDTARQARVDLLAATGRFR
ncbi:MAG TPA: TolC family protein [Myxococcales bacterium]|nr:TolC family protein [Myxococcales bacterium]